ncbi:hypothetical protein [Streptomyces sp. NRRL F-5135]|uniref:hypothetical protein n=1 Tax=Streptomyces sp. NRRL F-5135 TaxID=1463858 RepID=UPI0004CAFA89|nr:hypothetical protein [Streptomyces sp. NRRL F-5135]
MPKKENARRAMGEWVGIVADDKAKADRRGGDPVMTQDLADARDLANAFDTQLDGPTLTDRITARVPGLRR